MRFGANQRSDLTPSTLRAIRFTAESAYDQLRQLYNKQIELTDGEQLEFKANAPKK